jgi:hypothetical protein
VVAGSPDRPDAKENSGRPQFVRPKPAVNPLVDVDTETTARRFQSMSQAATTAIAEACEGKLGKVPPPAMPPKPKETAAVLCDISAGFFVKLMEMKSL